LRANSHPAAGTAAVAGDQLSIIRVVPRWKSLESNGAADQDTCC
jgi:hypothetical protein